jgi:hypothetical protein
LRARGREGTRERAGGDRVKIKRARKRKPKVKTKSKRAGGRRAGYSRIQIFGGKKQYIACIQIYYSIQKYGITSILASPLNKT